MHLKYRGVNDAFRGLVYRFNHPTGLDFPMVKTGSRVGNVLQVTEPMTITYLNPRERVLFNPARDCNPFFHLYESLWMLAGCNEIAPLEYYAKNYRAQVDDGDGLANGAYGHRWRNGWYHGRTWRDKPDQGGMDQLRVIIRQLQDKPGSRRVVLQMWNVEDDLLKIDTSKDVCCNTNAYFLIVNDRLDMTVCNRSNDLIWGMLGANVVHFSFLQEYLANAIGVEVGVYNQFTNNLHIYCDREDYKPKEWLHPVVDGLSYADSLEDREVNGGVLPADIPLVKDVQEFDYEVACFIKDPFQEWKEPWLERVAKPMCQAFKHHKARQYDLSYECIDRAQAEDWAMAGKQWLQRREANYAKRTTPSSL